MDLGSLQSKRFYLKIFFFLSGILFASWASRIPTIKGLLSLNDAELGSLLFILPIGSLVGLPISGYLIAKFNSKELILGSCILQAIALTGIGFAQNIFILGIFLFLFAFAMRLINIAVNTQSVNLQKFYAKPIIGSFHGIWSMGGIAGAGITSLLLSLNIDISYHFLAITAFVFIGAAISYRKLLGKDRADKGNKLIFGKPDPYIMRLGFLGFFAAICEGGMFDWSGIYFKEVLHTPIFTYGYFTFLVFMASFRFVSDKVISKIGIPNTYILSTCLIISGVLLSIIFPYFWIALIGFALTGMGTASIFPMTLGLAGKSTKYSAGMGISIVATYSIVGMLLGPPLIGYISHLFNLRIAFILFALSGLMFIPVSNSLFKIKS
ncbi:MFS transporter [Pedobacter psychrophilus]|uniref:MFS transporter n=1 Tax=Pedobacter psychrophilus TaxID=1826909 RepID=A0A179DK02_9SPHI|nr:MFS transporter [Pedobacter psychrophilus]OAQ40733.1 MFS transporter [Pedobacter psychrophilus]